MKPIRLRNAAARFTAARDDAGVPHIEAADWDGALYGLGYLHATDRPTQLLFARSVAAGRGAEEIVASTELLETDMFFRRVGLHLRLAEEVAAMPAEIRKPLHAYCAGVNAGLAAKGRTWPMWAVGYQPRPWDEAAVLLVGKLLSFGGLAVSQLQAERLIVELVKAGVSDLGLRELFSPRLDHVDLALLRAVHLSTPLSDAALELLADLPRLAGSNAWAVAPYRSASGHALLAADPHLEVNRLPAIWYEAVLRFGDAFVLGATLPGCPLFGIGRSQRLAWGVTYLKGDAVDYFIEDCRRGGRTGWQYRRGDAWFDFHVRQEEIRSKGRASETLRVYENAQGALELDPEAHGPGLYLSIAWSGVAPGASRRSIATWLQVPLASSVAEGMRIARYCPQPTLCWVFADRDGHIGKQACGLFPHRGGGQLGLAPIPAWDNAYHWQGWLDPELLPREYDPACGYVATANEELNTPDLPPLVTQPSPDYRLRRIVEVLEELPLASVRDMQALQYDVESVQARDLMQMLLPHLPAGLLRDRLLAWDCRYDVHSRGAPLFLRLYRSLMAEAFGRTAGIGWRRMLYLCSRAGFSLMVLTAADRLLSQERSYWWRGTTKRALIRAAARLAEANHDDETWGELNTFHFVDRFFQNREVGRLLGLSSRRYPMPGNYATPFNGHVQQTATRETTFAPSYHFVTDLAQDEAWTNMPGGPSESWFSYFYKSDVPHWLTGEYKRLAPPPRLATGGAAG